MKEALVYLPFTGVSALFLNFCHRKQETEGCSLKMYGYKDHHGTYTLQVSARLRAGNKKGPGFYRLTVSVPCL